MCDETRNDSGTAAEVLAQTGKGNGGQSKGKAKGKATPTKNRGGDEHTKGKTEGKTRGGRDTKNISCKAYLDGTGCSKESSYPHFQPKMQDRCFLCGCMDIRHGQCPHTAAPNPKGVHLTLAEVAGEVPDTSGRNIGPQQSTCLKQKWENGPMMSSSSTRVRPMPCCQATGWRKKGCKRSKQPLKTRSRQIR